MPKEDQDESPTVLVAFHTDDGTTPAATLLLIENASMVEYRGRLMPGVRLSPVGAMALVESLMKYSREVVENALD